MSDWPKKILVGTDGSEDAALAVRAALDLSSEAGAELHVVHAWRRPQALPLARPGLAYPSLEAISHSETLEREAEELLEEQADRIRAADGTLARAHLREGRAAEEISGLAEELGADLVVVGSRGAGTVKRLTTGSVSEGVAHLAKCPVLVVRGGEGAWPPNTVILGDDFSDEARRAGELAARISRLFEARMLSVWAYSMTLPGARRASHAIAAEEVLKKGEKSLEERAAELEGVLGKRPETLVTTGDAASIMQSAAEEGREPTLVAVGSRGLGAVKRFALGSVSTDVLRAVSGSVLIVPSSKEAPR